MLKRSASCRCSLQHLAREYFVNRCLSSKANDEVDFPTLPLAHLEQGDLGRLRDLDAHSVQNLGLSDELQDLLVEVDVQLPIVRVPDDKRSLFVMARFGGQRKSRLLSEVCNETSTKMLSSDPWLTVVPPRPNPVLPVGEKRRNHLKPRLGLLDALHPRLVPEVLEGDQSARYLVINLFL